VKAVAPAALRDWVLVGRTLQRGAKARTRRTSSGSSPAETSNGLSKICLYRAAVSESTIVGGMVNPSNKGTRNSDAMRCECVVQRA